jgi:hypothetical protein
MSSLGELSWNLNNSLFRGLRSRVFMEGSAQSAQSPSLTSKAHQDLFDMSLEMQSMKL